MHILCTFAFLVKETSKQNFMSLSNCFYLCAAMDGGGTEVFYFILDIVGKQISICGTLAL